MTSQDQGPKDDLGAGYLFTLDGLSGSPHSTQAFIDLATFGFKAFDFLLVGYGDLHGGNSGGSGCEKLGELLCRNRRTETEKVRARKRPSPKQ